MRADERRDHQSARPVDHRLAHDEMASIGRLGHNAGAPGRGQWQEPNGDVPQMPPADRDLDLVEQEFLRSALVSADPTSLLRLARVPFVADIGGGKLMRLLSIKLSDEIEVGAISAGCGGADIVYHPAPAARVTHSRNLRFVYHTPDGIRAFTYAEIRNLPDLAWAGGRASARRRRRSNRLGPAAKPLTTLAPVWRVKT